MKNLITTLTLLLVLELTASCASQHTMYRGDYEKEMGSLQHPPENNTLYTDTRSKWSDKNMRVMVDGRYVGNANALEVQTLLVNQDKWTVIDRGVGFNAVQKEQNLIHNDSPGRFENKEKWAHWGKMKGAGAVVLPYAHCELEQVGRRLVRRDVGDMTLTMVDATTGEVIAAVRGDAKCDTGHVLNWEPLVEALADKYPHKFEKDQRYRNLIDYEDQSKSESLKKKFE